MDGRSNAVGGGGGASLELVTGSIPASDDWGRYNFGYLSENQTMVIINQPVAQQVKVIKGSIFYTNASTEAAVDKTAVGADELISATSVIRPDGVSTMYKFFIANDNFTLS